MFDREPKFERWCWGESLGGPSNRGDRSLMLGVLRTCPGIIDDRADDSRRLLLMEKSDWVLGEGEGAEGDAEDGFSFVGKVRDWPEFRIVDKRNGLRDRGPEDSGCWSSIAE